MPSKRYEIRAENGVATIYLYEEIDGYWGVGPKQIRDDLKAAGEVSLIRLRIHSEGGSFFDGNAVYSLLKNHPARVQVFVDGMALSMASLVAMAGDEIIMAENAYMMIHDPTTVAGGDADYLRSMADLLDKAAQTLADTYAKRTGLAVDQIVELMANETWMTAPEAKELGFADAIGEGMQLAAHVDPRRFARVPKLLQNRTEGEGRMSDPVKNTPENQPASYQDLKAAFPKASADFLTGQLDRNATLEQARAAYQADLEAKAQAAEERAAAADKKAQDLEAKAKGREGVEPLGTGAGAAGGGAADASATDQFWAEVAELEKRGLPRAKAIRQVTVHQPDLHKQFLAEHNAQHGRRIPA